MKKIEIALYICGMTDEWFSDTIMIYKPSEPFVKVFEFENDIVADYRVSGLIKQFCSRLADEPTFEKYMIEFLNLDNAYIYERGALFGLKQDKFLSELFSDFCQETIHFAFFIIAGGASISHNGYRFIVHPDEEIHKHRPHVHVQKNGAVTRYSLETLTRFPEDKITREFLRDEKKVIHPYLKKNQQKLQEYWDLYIKGYIPPEEDCNGKQYYKET